MDVDRNNKRLCVLQEIRVLKMLFSKLQSCANCVSYTLHPTRPKQRWTEPGRALEVLGRKFKAGHHVCSFNSRHKIACVLIEICCTCEKDV